MISLSTATGEQILTDGNGKYYYAHNGAEIGANSPMYRTALNAFNAYQSAAAAGKDVTNPNAYLTNQYLPSTYVTPQEQAALTAPPTGPAATTQVINGQQVTVPGTPTSYPSGAPANSPYAGGYSAPNPPSAQIDSWIAGQNLSADEQAAIRAIYTAVSSNDADYASKVSAAMAAATQYSSPYFKAQVRMVTDALSRTLQSKDGDLSYDVTQKQNALEDLRRDIAASKDKLTVEQQAELLQLERSYQKELDTTQEDLASRGFTSSSTRAKSEKYLSDSYSSMRESSNMNYAFKNMQLADTLSRTDRDTTAQIENLRRLASEGKLDATRSAEGQVGSQNLSQLGYTNLLGDQGGSIPKAQVEDALSFANSFVF